jgi:hypothetical protein
MPFAMQFGAALIDSPHRSSAAEHSVVEPGGHRCARNLARTASIGDRATARR